MHLQPEIFVSEKARTLFEYWLTLAPPGQPPRRRDFDPAAVPDLLPEILMVRPTDDGDFRISLLGTAQREAFGEELTGESIFARIGRREAERLRQIQTEALTGRSGFVTLRQFYRDNGKHWTVQGLALPMLGEDGIVSRNLAGFFSLTAAEFGERRGAGLDVDRTTLQGAWRYDIARGTFAVARLD